MTTEPAEPLDIRTLNQLIKAIDPAIKEALYKVMGESTMLVADLATVLMLASISIVGGMSNQPKTIESLMAIVSVLAEALPRAGELASDATLLSQLDVKNIN